MINFYGDYNVHFIGVGGVSMHNLALFCKSLGWNVSASDIKNNHYCEQCEKNGIKVHIGHKKSNIGNANIIIKSGAIKDENIELKYAKNKNIVILDRADFLAEITKKFKTVISVAGTHGKSTTSYMIYNILKDAGKKVSCHIGADIVDQKINLDDEILVVEACEYNKSFLKLKTDIGVVLNVDNDHLECYGTYYQLKNSFITFLKHAKARYVFDCNSTEFIKVRNLIKVNKPIMKKNQFKFEDKIFKFDKIIGEQYACDASVAIKICLSLGVKYKVIYNSLKKLNYLPRRNELIGKIKGAKIIIYYAHHPTEIKFLMENYKNRRNLFIFQPHTFSRTKLLKDDFVKVLSNDNVVIYKEYSAREKSTEGLSAYQLYEEIYKLNENVKYFDSVNPLETYIGNKLASSLDNIFFIGAGDINEVAQMIAKS